MSRRIKGFLICLCAAVLVDVAHVFVGRESIGADSILFLSFLVTWLLDVDK